MVDDTRTPSPVNTLGIMDRLTRLLPFLVVGLAAAFAFRRLCNTDTWWHLASGRWIITHGTIPHLDVLSWTVPDHAWTNVQWLFDVLIYGIYSLGGPTLLVASSMTAYASSTAIILVIVRRHLGPLSASVLCAWAVLISQERFEIRPEMLSYLFLSVLLWLYATGREANSRRLWAVPIVMCLWANCHSLFVLGMVIIISQMAGSFITDLPILPSGWRRPLEPVVRKRLLASGAFALAAVLLNPYFLTGALFPFKLMSRISGKNSIFMSIGEFRRPFENYFISYSVTAYRWFFFFAIAAVLAAMIVAAIQRRPEYTGSGKELSRAERRRLNQMGKGRKVTTSPPPQGKNQAHDRNISHINFADIAVLTVMGYLSILARRNIPLLALVGAPVVAACLALVATRIPLTMKSALNRMRIILAVVLMLLFLGGYWFIASNGFYKWSYDLYEFGPGTLSMRFPIRAAAFMKEQGLPGRLYNDLGNGGYLTWAEPIPGGVYIDGRLEVYDTDFFRQYMRQIANPRAWQDEMDRQGIQTVLQFHWWGNTRNLINYLVHDSRWALVYYDETSVLLVRREGNEKVIARALAAFEKERVATEQAFLEPVHSWQWPMGRIRALEMYSGILNVIGRSDDARRFQNLVPKD